MKELTAKIKVMLSSRPRMLSDVIRNMVTHQPDMEVVGEVIDPIELLIAVKKIQVDVVIITPVTSAATPRICSQLLEEHPSLKVMTLPAEGNTAYLYQAGAHRRELDEPSEGVILAAIRSSTP